MSGPSSINPGALWVSDLQRRPDGIREAARQLEGVFISMMFEEMAQGLDGGEGLLPSGPGGEMYDQWFRTEMAEQLARKGGLGLGDIIAGQLEVRGTEGDRESRRRGPHAPGPRPLPQLDAPGQAEASSDDGAPSMGNLAPPPVEGRITSRFGQRVHPLTGALHHHRGVDLAAPHGTPVRAPFQGHVREVEIDAQLGLHVVVDHPDGYRSTYAHLSEASVRPGDRVEASTVLGKSGDSGRTTGPHLHFSLRREGRDVDPERLIRFRR